MRKGEGFERLADLHIHTEKSPCAVSGYSVMEVAETAVRRGLRLVAITDHYHGPGNRPSLEELREEVERARSAFDGRLAILLGAEADILTVSGELSIEPEVARSLDFLLASPHFVPAGGRCLPEGEKGKVTFAGPKFREIVEEALPDFLADFREALLSVVKGGLASGIAHPLILFPHTGLANRKRGPIRNLFDIGDERYWAGFLEAARRSRVCLEVSGKSARADSGWGGLRELVEMAVSFGVKVFVSSDAHRPEDVGRLEDALAFLRRCNVPPEALVSSPADFRRPSEGL